MSLDEEDEFNLISQSVQAWYRFYQMTPDLPVTQTLCKAAVEFYFHGTDTLDELSTMLIRSFVGTVATRTTPASSQALH